MENRPPAFLSRSISRRRSGQIYSEATCPMSSMVPSWITATTGSTADLASFRNTESLGAPCLELMAVRSIMLNLNHLGQETLSCVPWTVGRKIWAHIRRLRLDSLRTWRMFVRAYPDEREAFQEPHKVPLLSSKLQCRFGQIIKQITAPGFEWITHLILQDSGLSRADWTAITSIRNLGALLIIGSGSRDDLDDRIVRAWGEAAKEDNALSKLRVLLLINEAAITTVSFNHLHALPALRICNLSGCAVDPDEAEAAGWKPFAETMLAHQLNGDCVSAGNVFDAMRTYFRRAASPTLAEPAESTVDELPLLSLFRRAAPPSNPFDLRTTCLWFSRVDAKTASAAQTEESSTSKGPPRKKPKLRAVKKKTLDDVMGNFGA